MDQNMQIYEAVRSVPDTAMKPITGGRLKGMTDIDPMWRIKTLTEQFGPCGIGWYTEITDKWTEQGAGGAVAAFVNINLYIQVNGAWSKSISGTGGSMLVEKERNGLYTSDECFKKAYTDALSVCCKMLGIGADVYWNRDDSKYNSLPAGAVQKESLPREALSESPPPEMALNTVYCPVCQNAVKPAKKKNGVILSPEQIVAKWGMCAACKNRHG